MTADELEFAISRYIDGTLNPLEQASLEEVLATDQSARELLAEYQRLNSALKTTLPNAEIDLDQLNAGISRSLAEAEAPVRHMRIAPMTIMKFVAVAASIAILIGIVGMMFRDNSTGRDVIVSVPEISTGTAIVQGPSAGASTGAAIVEVSIGAPPGIASAGAWQDQAIISRTPRVVIESSASPAQDSAMPY